MNKLINTDFIEKYMESGREEDLLLVKGSLEKSVNLPESEDLIKSIELSKIKKKLTKKVTEKIFLERVTKLIQLISQTYKEMLFNTEEKLREETERHSKEKHKTLKNLESSNHKIYILHSFCKSGRRMMSINDYEEIIDLLMETTKRIFEDCFCVMYKIDKNNRLKAYKTNHSDSDKFVDFFNNTVTMKTGEGAEGCAVDNGSSMYIGDVFDSLQYKKFTKLANEFNFKSVLSVPLMSEGNLEGSLALYSRETRWFPREEVEAFALFAEQTAAALENTKLYKALDRSLRAKIVELYLMHEIDRSIANNDKLSRIAENIFEWMEQLIPRANMFLDLTRIDPGLICYNRHFDDAGFNIDLFSDCAMEIYEKQDRIEKNIKLNNVEYYCYGFPIFHQEEITGLFWIVTDPDFRIQESMLDFIRWILEQLNNVIEKNRILEQLFHAEKINVLGSLLSGIAHELNNPLSRILGLSETALSEISGLPDVEKNFGMIRDESLRCKGIIGDFLAFARKYKTSYSISDVNQVIKKTLQLWKYQKKTEDMKILTKLHKEPLTAKINVNRLQQVILNLIVNAYFALRSTGQESKILKIQSKISDNRIVLIFKDNGPGIKPKVIDKIFQPFFTTKAKGQGTGLGLSLCRDIMREHGGDISLKSEYGRGAAFILDLPIAEKEEEKIKQPGVSRKIAVEGIKVLIADDDALILKFMSTFLKRHGFKVDTATNGRRCLEKLRARNYDILISDMIMPDIRGDQLIEILNKENPEMLKRMVLCTGDILERDKLTDYESKKVHIMYKPFELIQLKEMVEEVLSKLHHE